MIFWHYYIAMAYSNALPFVQDLQMYPSRYVSHKIPSNIVYNMIMRLFATWHYGSLERNIDRKYTQHNLWYNRTLLHKGLQIDRLYSKVSMWSERANIFHEWTEIMRRKRLNNESSLYKCVKKCNGLSLSALVRFCSDSIGQHCGWDKVETLSISN